MGTGGLVPVDGNNGVGIVPGRHKRGRGSLVPVCGTNAARGGALGTILF